MAKTNANKSRDTVRRRSRSGKGNTQRYLPFAEIRNDTILMKSGGLRAVLEIQPLNFNLKSETEQQGIVSGYESFLNTLDFPIQIVIRSTKVNIDFYKEKIAEQTKKITNPLLKEQMEAYGAFVEKVVEVADIMQKKFFMVVPLDDTPPAKNVISQFLSWLQIDDSFSKALQRNRRFTAQAARLKERLDLVETGMQNIGLKTRRLNTKELIVLFYAIYNRGLSQTQKLQKMPDVKTEPNVL